MASFGMPFCYLYAHAQNGHMTTSAAGLMTEEMAVYRLVEQQLSTKKKPTNKNVARCKHSRTADENVKGFSIQPP